MSTANETSLQILGAAILWFTGMGPDGKSCQTRQIVYITDSTDKIYLSREGCVALGLISKDFPTIGEVKSVTAAKECDCPQRELPPPEGESWYWSWCTTRCYRTCTYWGSSNMVSQNGCYCQEKMASQDEQWTSNHLTDMQHVKHTTQVAPSTKHVLYLMVQRKQC